MAKSTDSYNERFKKNQEKLKKRAKELLSDTPDEDEPQFIGSPDNILEEEDDDESETEPNK
jgi:hypothetical protein